VDEEQMRRYREEQAMVDKLMATLLAKVKATELAVATLIESHPNPKLALALWNLAYLEMSDESLEKGTMAGYQDQMKASLAMWSRGFRSAAEAKGTQPDASQSG